MTPRMRWIALAAATLLGAAAGWRARPPTARDAAPAGAPALAPAAPASDRARAAPPALTPAPAYAPPSRPLAKALPPMKVKPGGTSWNPDPATKPAPVEAQRGGPDIAGAQPLRPPPSASP
ncbi:hypothetical protein BFR06_19015 [Burkholderia pseudomallei]|uniref:hypothetical protein n=1 Tax=Burkholderia pseudomallei TaxID=28450 RepID=UPI0004F80DEC|nr:hypothetical protein [Burkholderia pseudomallei]AIP18503.1 hypothetical protein DP63_4499 [Burkholderia pseudomallei MSHR5855]AIP43257.1 hypothetical protein DP65_4818 [Burkholderia pseudomallei MSHR5848]AIV65679.1 hypothetical protein X993_4457 [Burkholderia pseudomallei K42]APG00065.1 hypothetical protein BFR06_19015 [Burkholderia pseudomallei]KGC30975.1 hypothetical protein DO62_1447 [Burkholderia pseudomallei]